MTRRAILRADAGKRIGYGHFFRSLALADYLREDFQCFFVSHNEDQYMGAMSDYQLSEIFKICIPESVIGETLQEFNKNFLETVHQGDLVILDNYYYDTDYQQAIRDKGCKLVCIDDMHQYHMVCDLVLTPSPLERENFSLEPYTKFEGGIEWSFLREPFLSEMKKRNVFSQFDKVVLAMGGSDIFNLTDKMIEAVSSVVPESQIDVICGELVNVSRQNDPNVKIHRSISADEIVELFDDADVGIFSASTICIEAISRRLPVIAGYYVNNQEEFYNYGVKHNYFSGLGCLLDDVSKIEDRLGRLTGSNLQTPIEIDFLTQKEKIIDLFKSL